MVSQLKLSHGTKKKNSEENENKNQDAQKKWTGRERAGCLQLLEILEICRNLIGPPRNF